MSDFFGNVEISAKDVFRMIDKLKTEVSSDIMMKALTIGGMVLRDSAKERLLKKMPKAQSAKGREKDTTMLEGIRVSKNESGGYVNVYILGNYLNRWFESGTDDRQLKRTNKAISNHHRTYKKGENRGRLSALHFFRDAKEQDMSQVMDKIIEIVDRSIEKIIDE